MGKLDPPAPGGRPTRVRFIIFVLIGAASWLLYLQRYSWGVIKPDFRQENPLITDTELGWLDSAFLVTYALAQVPGGLAGDLFVRAVLMVIIALWSLAVASLAWTTGFWPLFGMRAAFGLAQAGAYPAISKVTRSWFPLATRTGVQGAVAALGRVGAACASLLIATFLITWLGLTWRGALVAIALPGILLALGFWVAFRNTPREHPWANRAEREVIEKGSPPSVPGGRIALKLDGPARVSLAILLVYSFCSTFADMLYVFWIPSFLVEGKGLDRGDMGWFATLPLLGGAVGGVVGGALNDLFLRRTKNPRWARSGVAFTGKILATTLILASLTIADGRWVMVMLLLCKFFGDWSLPTQWGTITDMAGKGSGTVFGLVNTIGSLGGFAAGPGLGYLKQHHGWEGLFLGVATAYLVAALSWLFIDCTRRVVVDP